MDYKIEVGVTPQPSTNINKPYYWTLFCYHNAWCNEGTGWESNPARAFDEAYQFYSKKINKSAEN